LGSRIELVSLLVRRIEEIKRATVEYVLSGSAFTKKMFQTAHKLYIILAMIFMTSLLIANLFGSMLFSFHLPFNTPLGDKVLLSAGIIPFPVTFVLTDLINEFYGKRGARFITWLGFGMSVLVYIMLAVLGWVPVDPISQITRPGFLHLSGLYTNMFVASLLAYLVGQFLDIFLFGVFHRWTKSRMIWLRATGSTVVSQLFDSLIVTTIAFWGNYPPEVLITLALSNYVWKFFIVLSTTPALYAGHALLRRLIGGQAFFTEADKLEAEPI
jgi:uncharacterized integral membrane protein (TIGR00697 family)